MKATSCYTCEQHDLCFFRKLIDLAIGKAWFFLDREILEIWELIASCCQTGRNKEDGVKIPLPTLIKEAEEGWLPDNDETEDYEYDGL